MARDCMAHDCIFAGKLPHASILELRALAWLKVLIYMLHGYTVIHAHCRSMAMQY
jgi:hypothetical protein